MHFETMDIYSKPGSKVRFKGVNGYDFERGHALQTLVMDEIYEVKKTIVHQSSTDVELKEFPERYFNSVMFENVPEPEPIPRPPVTEKDIEELVNAATEMIEAYNPSYDNKWMSEDGWGVSRRKSYINDSRVLERLKKAIERVGG